MRVSWLSSSRCRIAPKKSAPDASPLLLRTLRIIAWLTENVEVSCSGSAATSRSNVLSLHDTKPSGGFVRTTRLSFFGSSPAFATRFAFSTSWSGACTTTVPTVS